MKPGINQWGFPGGMPATECISLAKSLGFTSFEVCVGEEGPTLLSITEAEATAIRKHAEKEGVALHSVASGMGWQYPLTSTEAEVHAKGRAGVARTLEIAHWLGAEAILLVPGIVDEKTPYDLAWQNALSGIRALLPEAEKHGVIIGVENVWNKFLLSPMEMRTFIDECGSPFVGAYVDVGNMLPYGYPEQWIRILGKRICAIHMKDFRCSVGTLGGFVMLLEGDVNWPAVMAELRAIGYSRGLTAEFWPYAHSLEGMLKQASVSLNTILSMH